MRSDTTVPREFRGGYNPKTDNYLKKESGKLIRKATRDDLPAILEIYGAARRLMAERGNPGQWGDGYPQEEILSDDIARGRLYAVYDEMCCSLSIGDRIRGVFMFEVAPDPTYRYIEGGEWLSESEYGVIHRIAGSGGVFDEAFAYCRDICPHLRADTHRLNSVMRHLLTTRGFSYRGIIYVRDNSPREAYEFIGSWRC